MERIISYTPAQVAQLQTYISETFGGGEDDLVGHEIESEYVHTDVQIIATKDNDLCFVTTGMGARKMIDHRCELSYTSSYLCDYVSGIRYGSAYYLQNTGPCQCKNNR